MDVIGPRAVRLARVLALVTVATTGCRDPKGGDEGGSSSSSSSESGGETEGGSLPPTPTLATPEDGATDLPVQTELCWNPVEDPDGDEVRYRVFVDDIELSEGIMGDEEGYAGPCTGTLDLDFERTYAWEVQAFEAQDPDRQSAKSERWSFSTRDDGESYTVFEDDFEDDRGWQVEGDATRGAWVRGEPTTTMDGNELSQPGRCDGQQNCYFTGVNDGQPDDEDVAGGSTILFSPSFDLTGAAAATVQLRRFFYKSDAAAGPSLRVELLVPDDDAPGGFAAHELSRLDAPTTDLAHNLWAPLEFQACDVPMVVGSRLRITATDEGDGILEAAIDSVSVHGHHEATICQPGEGGACDPDAGDAACPDELLCCNQGSLNLGVYRCNEAVRGLDFDDPPATAEDPNNGELGCPAPDMFVEEKWIEPMFNDILMEDDTCEVLEQCVGGTGWRTVMRFTAAVPNIGSDALHLGIPANNPEVFHYSPCHKHYHFDEFARYELLDQNNVVATGHKQAFCLLDFISWAWPLELPVYDCANQGLSRGFSDWYEAEAPCQWVDVTDVAPGDYTLRIRLNPPRPQSKLPLLYERRYDNNVLEVPVTVP